MSGRRRLVLGAPAAAVGLVGVGLVVIPRGGRMAAVFTPTTPTGPRRGGERGSVARRPAARGRLAGHRGEGAHGAATAPVPAEARGCSVVVAPPAGWSAPPPGAIAASE